MARRSVPLTQAGKERLQEELIRLREERLPDIASRIQDETESGDDSANSEYEELKESRILVEARIHELEETLNHAAVIDHAPADGSVGLGSRVRLRCDDGVEESWVLVDPREAHAPSGAISTESPAGQAVLGQRAGSITTFAVPDGVLTCTILSVE